MPPPGDLGAQAPKLRAEPGATRSPSPTPPMSASPTAGAICSRRRPSDGSYGSPVVPGIGLIPSNRGSQSRPDPRHPAGVAPGKRPRLTPNPALAIKGGDQFLPFGTPGGDVQTQAMLQVLLNVFVHGQDVQSAIESPRFASYSYPSSFAPYDYYPGRLSLEGRIPEEVIAELARRGHEIERWPDWIWLAGASARSSPTAAAASWKPAPTRAAPPTRWVGKLRTGGAGVSPERTGGTPAVPGC